jgi:hypothetical protein
MPTCAKLARAPACSACECASQAFSQDGASPGWWGRVSERCTKSGAPQDRAEESDERLVVCEAGVEPIGDALRGLQRLEFCDLAGVHG